MVSLPSDTTGRGTALAESLQKPEDVVTDVTLCPENKDLCRQESDEGVHGLSPVRNDGVQITEQNEKTSPVEVTLMELTLNGSGQQNEELAINDETKSTSVSEEEGCVTGILDESASDQNSVQDTSISCIAVMPEHISDSVVSLEGPELRDSISSDQTGSDFHMSRAEKASVANICTVKKEEYIANSHTIVSGTEEEYNVNLLATTAVNEGAIALNHVECCSDSVVNGQMPTTVTQDKEPSESKTASVATATAPGNMDCVSGSGVVEQRPVKLPGAESKKGKVS
jgi:hypothetical protein